MEVDAAKPRQGEHPRRNDAAVGDNDDGVRGNRIKAGAKFRVIADFFRLGDGETGGQCCLLDGRRCQFLLAADGAIWLCNDEGNLMSRGEQGFQGRHGKLRSAAKNEAQTS